MQLEGFKFNIIYIEIEGGFFDLHNCFDFTGLSFDFPKRLLSLHWSPNEYAKPEGLEDYWWSFTVCRNSRATHEIPQCHSLKTIAFLSFTMMRRTIIAFLSSCQASQ